MLTSTPWPRLYHFSLYNSASNSNNNKHKGYKSIKQTSGNNSNSNNNKIHHHEHHWGPFFEEPLNANTEDKTASYIIAKVHLFTETILNCRVGMLRDKTVGYSYDPNDPNGIWISFKSTLNIIFSKQ